MTVLLIALLFVLILGLGGVCWYLFSLLMRSQEAFNNLVRLHATDTLNQAKELAQRAPTETRDLINVVTESVNSQGKIMMDAVRTAWNPNPVTSTDAEPTMHRYNLPIPYGSDEAQQPDDSDPTDFYFGRTDRQNTAQVSEDNPFGIEGLPFADPLKDVK